MEFSVEFSVEFLVEFLMEFLVEFKCLFFSGIAALTFLFHFPTIPNLMDLEQHVVRNHQGFVLTDAYLVRHVYFSKYTFADV